MKFGKRGLTKRFHLVRRPLLVLTALMAATILFSSCFEISIFSYDPLKACNGLTLFSPYMTNLFEVVDMSGNILFEYELSHIRLDADFEVLADGDILLMGQGSIYLLRIPDTIEWTLSAPLCHHGVIRMPNGHIMYLYSYFMDVEGWDLPFFADGIREVDPSTGDTLWEWRSGDHLSTDDYCPWHIETIYDEANRYDWTHSNAIVYREEESAVYLNVRNLDRLVKIDYPSGQILWSMGRGGDFGEGLFFHPHDPELLENGNILLFDNGNHRYPVEHSRAVEIAYDPALGWAEEVWAWPSEPLFFDSAMGDANRLPNGNTLVTSSHHGSIFEVTRTGEVVWNMILEPLPGSIKPIFYKSERIPAQDFPIHTY